MSEHKKEHPHQGHAHPEHGHHGHGRTEWRWHHDWRSWVVILMLLAMAVYVVTNSESLWPGRAPQPAMPEAP
ncbi:MAG TPA: hypothetical protein VGG30_12945 [Pirellulales bacterium]|jgi:hypothetical protein